MISEYEIQCTIAEYLDRIGVLWSASAGGVRLSIGAARKLKQSGYRKGCPDIMIFEPRGQYHGLMIELKANRKTSRPYSHQVEFVKRLKDNGYYAVVSYGFDMTMHIIKDYLSMGKNSGNE